jgi:uncharacterized protein YqeY
MSAGTPSGSGDVAKSQALKTGRSSVNLLNGEAPGYAGGFPNCHPESIMIRDEIKAALTSAMKAGDRPRTGALRLVQSALKNRDIELRGSGGAPADDDVLVTEVLQKMVKQRRESIDMYKKGNREELAQAEAAEVAVIEEFLPKQLSDEEIGQAIDAAMAEAGAASVKDMGRVMALVKERHAGQLDMSKASQMVKAKLS